MTLYQKGRFFYWLIRELTDKYTKFFFIGFLIGCVIPFILHFTSPNILLDVLPKEERIGMVGQYEISSLPSNILNLISTGLTQIDKNGSPSAALSESWEATDSGKTYSFTLKDMYWHDGKKVVSSDINYNIKGVTVEFPDEKTIKFHLNVQYSPFPVVVAKPVFKKGLVGVGEYRVGKIRMVDGLVRSLTLTAPGKTPKKFVFYKTDTQAHLAYQSGDIDQIANLDTLDIAYYTNWKNTKVVPTVSHNRMLTLFFNMSNDLLKEKSIRQALAYATPHFETEEQAVGPISKTSWAFSDTVKHFSYDPIQAKKLFDQTKIGTSSASLTLHTFSPYMDIAQKIADSWTEAGIKTEVRVENNVPQDYQVLLTVRELPIDPDQYAFWHSTQTKTNISNYKNVKVDKLLEDGRTELNQEVREKLYADFQKQLMTDLPAFFLYYPKVYSIVRK